MWLNAVTVCSLETQITLIIVLQMGMSPKCLCLWGNDCQKNYKYTEKQFLLSLLLLAPQNIMIISKSSLHTQVLVSI